MYGELRDAFQKRTRSALYGGRRYDANGFTAGAVRVEGAAMCTGGLLTEWRGVARLDDVTEDSLALMFAVKPAPGACAANLVRRWVSGVSKGLLATGHRWYDSCRSWQKYLQGQWSHKTPALTCRS